MSERVLTYFAKLKSLTDEELDQSTRDLAVEDKQNSARIIANIAEIGDRTFHLKRTYSSLFQYCRDELNLSEGSVHRRTQVAGVCRKFPQILEALFTGRLHLTGASLIAPHLTTDNVEQVINEAEGKTKREVEKYLVTLSPKEPFQPSVRKQAVRGAATSDSEVPDRKPEAAGTEGGAPEKKPASPAGGQRTADVLKPATEERYNFRFSAAKEFTEKFRRLAEVLGIQAPHSNIEEIFDKAMEIALEKKDPKRKLQRRRNREERKRSRCEEQTLGRACPPHVKERMLEKAGYQCQYRGPDGSRCDCRTGLEIEHTKPWAIYRTHDERYLQVLCRTHNLLAAKEFYGSAFIQNKIDASRREKRRPPGVRAG